LWLDKETGFPLQTKLIGSDGAAIEQVKFADIRLGHEIGAEQLKPSINIENFRWFSQNKTVRTVDVESDWSSSDLPPGFRITKSHVEVKEGDSQQLVHMMISDGLANVSVFIEPAGDDESPRTAHAGAANSFSVIRGKFRVTAVGEVPLSTAEHIARSMQQN